MPTSLMIHAGFRRAWLKVCAGLVSIAFAAHAEDAERLPPEAMQVVAPMTPHFYRHSEGSAVRLASGRILLAWSRFYATEGLKHRGDDSPATIVLASSDDCGKTWSAPVELTVGTGRINVMQASFLQLGDRTQLYYSIRDAKTAADKWMIETTDEGRTWTSPRKLTPGGQRFTGPNDRMLQLSTGRILLPCHTTAPFKNRQEHAPIIAFSDDKSETYKLGAPLLAEEDWYKRKVPLKLHEPALIERKDGSVWMLIRSTAGRFFESKSTDAGATWSKPVLTEIETLTAPPQLRRLSDGRVIMLWNPHNKAAREHLEKVAKAASREPFGMGDVPVSVKRTLLAIAASGDDGRTWSKPKIIADGGSKFGYCYPAVLELKAEGELLVFASQTTDVITPSSLVMIRVPLKFVPNP